MNSVWITGGAGGLGGATVRALKNRGCRTVSFDLRPQPAADHSEIADVADPDGIAAAFDRADSLSGPAEAIVCLAGRVEDGVIAGLRPGGVARYDIGAWHRTIEANLTGTFLAAQAFALRAILKRRPGVIVTASSPAASGAAGQGAYAASKAGVEALTRSMAQELAPFGIRVCGIRPALTDTPMAAQYSEAQIESLRRRSLLGRDATADETAEAILFLLASPLASGRVYAFDGSLDL